MYVGHAEGTFSPKLCCLAWPCVASRPPLSTCAAISQHGRHPWASSSCICGRCDIPPSHPHPIILLFGFTPTPQSLCCEGVSSDIDIVIVTAKVTLFYTMCHGEPQTFTIFTICATILPLISLSKFVQRTELSGSGSEQDFIITLCSQKQLDR